MDRRAEAAAATATEATKGVRIYVGGCTIADAVPYRVYDAIDDDDDDDASIPPTNPFPHAQTHNPQASSAFRLRLPASSKVVTSLLGLTFGLRSLASPVPPAYAAAVDAAQQQQQQQQQPASSVVAPSNDGKAKGAYVCT